MTSPAKRASLQKWRQKPESKVKLAARARARRKRDREYKAQLDVALEKIKLYRETLVQVTILWKDTAEVIDPVLALEESAK